MTGGKCAETERSLESQVEESFLNCGARMTSRENCGKEDENVKMSLSGGLIWKVFWILEQLTCFFSPSAYIHYWPVGSVSCNMNMADMLSHTAICCSWTTILRCFYQLYPNNQCWNALPEQSLIFQATVLWVATCHINNGWNGLFYTWKVHVYDVGLIWPM